MKKSGIILFAAAILTLGGCSKSKKQDEAPAAQTGQFGSVAEQAPQDNFVKEAKLSDLAQKYGFKVGACVSFNQLNRSSYIKMLSGDFNTTTATNEFKAYSLLNQQKSIQEGVPVMNYAQADLIAKMAQENGLGIRGHVLVWDAYMNEWFFREGFKSDGLPVSKEVMEERVAYYIDQVITNF